MRPLRIAVRHSWGRYALPLFLCLEVVSLESRDRIWAIEWQWATSHTNGIMVLLGPLTAGVAAAESAHVRKHGGALVRALGRPGLVKAQLSRSVAVSAWAGSAHIMGLATTWVLVAFRHGEIGALEWRLVAPGLLLLVAFAFVGGAAGWLVPSLVTAPVIAALAYFVPATSIARPRMFLVGGSTSPLAGLEYRPDVLLAQSLLWVAVSGCALVTVLHRQGLGQMLILVGAATVIVAGSSVDRLGPDVLQARPVASYACVGPAPELCTPSDYRELLPTLAGTVRPVVTSLSAQLGRLPVKRLVAFSLASPTKGAAEIPVYLEPPFTDELNVALSVVKAATGCPSSAPIDHDVSLIVAGAVPRLRGWAAGAAGIDPAGVPDQAGARSRFEALVEGCAP